MLPLGAWFTAWQASLQHEIIHGHPTRSRRLNRLIGCWPLLLWLPFEVYRISHLVHHRDERLTDPLDDPESHYWTPEQWAEVGFVRRRIIRANATLPRPGHHRPGLVDGPLPRPRGGGADPRRQAQAPDLGRARRARRAGRAWLVLVCDMNLWIYFVAFVYPGTALMLVRSFAEHRAESDIDERTAIVENAPVLGLLFLYNNLHVVHHERPGIPWYGYPAGTEPIGTASWPRMAASSMMAISTSRGAS